MYSYSRQDKAAQSDTHTDEGSSTALPLSDQEQQLDSESSQQLLLSNTRKSDPPSSQEINTLPFAINFDGEELLAASPPSNRTFQRLFSQYREYRTMLKEMGEVDGLQNILQARILLDEFLLSDAFPAILPGLLSDIKIFESVLHSQRESEIYSVMADELFAVSSYPGLRGMADYLSGRLEETYDPNLREYYRQLLELLLRS